MILEQVQLPSAQQSVNVSAKLIASIKMLQYSAQELEDALAQELAENPALEVEEAVQCQRCGSTLRAGLCPRCEQYTAAGNDGRDVAAEWDDYGEWRGTAAGDDERFDPLNFVRAGDTLHDHLIRQLGASLSDEDVPIIDYLIGSLDSHGYLATSTEEVAHMLGLPSERVEVAISQLQSLDPPGIGARNLSECLLIQLRLFDPLSDACSLATKLVSEHMRALGEHRFAEIAHAVGVPVSAVKRAWHFIRANLNPFPAHAFEPGDVPGLGVTSDTERSAVIRPDVVIRRTATGFDAEVIEMRRFNVSMNDIYQTLYQQSRSRRLAPRELDETGKQHVRQYVIRARFFMSCMRQRWETLAIISNALIELQTDFLERGIRVLKPMTRGQLAEYVGLHESTVSRATANKYVLLPEGRTIAFDDFFDASLSAKDYLRELIAGEHAAKPFSDEALADRLKDRGIHLARRTVAKYRESLGILPSRLRS